MAITLQDFTKHEWFYRTITLISDSSGLNSLVTWPYIRQTKELKPWVNGGEIVFVYNNADSIEQQIKLLTEGIEAKVSAFVFLLGKDFILKLPQETIDYANEHHMPVFSMPYNVKLIDVTKAIAEEIMSNENKERMSLNFISDLLSNDYKDEDLIKKEGYECGIDIDKPYIAVTFETDFDYNSKDYSKIMSFRNSFSYALKHIEQTASMKSARFICKIQAISAICFFVFDDSSVIDEICHDTDSFIHYHFLYSEINILIGYSNVHCGISQAKSAVNESKNAIMFCKKSEGTKSSCHYNELGLLRLLVNSNSKNELEEYCTQILGPLIESDKLYMTEYLLTVKTYLDNNNNMSTTSKKLFIHRNTLISRINRIEELTGKSLSDADVKLEYLCSFKLLEFFTNEQPLL